MNATQLEGESLFDIKETLDADYSLSVGKQKALFEHVLFLEQDISNLEEKLREALYEAMGEDL